jgi:uncharacterized protein
VATVTLRIRRPAVEIDTSLLTVFQNEPRHRFEIAVADEMAILTYRREPGRITYLHTEVPEALEGHGIAGKLAKHALDYARAQGLAVVPSCPYVRSYIERHPEYEDLVAR